MLNLRSTFCYQSRHCLQTHPFIFCNTVKCIQTPSGPRAPWSSTFAKFVQIMLHHYFVKVKEKKNAPNQRQNVNYTILFFFPQLLSGKYSCLNDQQAHTDGDQQWHGIDSIKAWTGKRNSSLKHRLFFKKPKKNRRTPESTDLCQGQHVGSSNTRLLTHQVALWSKPLGFDLWEIKGQHPAGIWNITKIWFFLFLGP